MWKGHDISSEALLWQWGLKIHAIVGISATPVAATLGNILKCR